MGEGGGGRGAKSDDGEEAWSSIIIQYSLQKELFWSAVDYVMDGLIVVTNSFFWIESLDTHFPQKVDLAILL
jgi:hypothetical protein